MKKFILGCFSFVLLLALCACGKQDEFEITLRIPPNSYAEEFVYSDEEISPLNKKITIWNGNNLGDCSVILKPIEVRQENSYEENYLTPGLSLKMDVEKGAWYKIGVRAWNESNEEKIVGIRVKGVIVRIK